MRSLIFIKEELLLPMQILTQPIWKRSWDMAFNYFCAYTNFIFELKIRKYRKIYLGEGGVAFSRLFAAVQRCCVG